MANVRFIKTTKQKYLNRDTYDPNALYFCVDTNEMFKGQDIYSDGIRIIPTHDDLPDCSSAADGVVYYVHDTRNGYILSPDRTEWLQTIYAPAEDLTAVPESEIYRTVTTVGAVRDIEKKIYEHIEKVASGGGIDSLTPVDGTIIIVNNANSGKSIGVAISPVAGNALIAVEGGLFVPTLKAGSGIKIVDGEISIRLADITHGLVAVDGTLSLSLATKDSDGAMSKEDKVFLDELKDLNISNTYATKTELQEIRESVVRIERSCVWVEM